MVTVADHRSKFKAVPEAKITQVNEKVATLRQDIQRLNGLNAQMMHGARQGGEKSSIQKLGARQQQPRGSTNHLPIAQLPGCSQGGGTARVTAAASMKAVSSI